MPTESVPCLLATLCQGHGNKTALISEQYGSYSYAELEQLVLQWEEFLPSLGVSVGQDQRVAFCPELEPRSIALFFALFRLRVVACPFDSRVPSSERHKVMCRLGASLFVDTTMMPTSLVTTPKEVMLSLAMEATCLLTSGSVSGVGKGVRHTLGNHLFSAKGFWEAFPSANHVSWALVLPLFHVGGLAILFRTFLAHGTVVLSKEPLGQLLQQRVTHISLVPTHLARLIHGVTKEWHPSRELSCVLMGGDRVSSILRSEGQALGLPLLISYGMTETSSLICATTSIVEGEVGHPLPYRKIKTDAAGKIFVQGKTVCLGYWEMTAPTEVWWPTQDCGYLDDTGGLTVTGRADRIFISGGENIDPLEIEQVLYLLPWVYEARVQAVPCFEFGHKGVAHIVTAPNQGSEEALLAHLSLYLPRFKLPRQFYIQALDLICPLGAQLMLSSHGSL